MQILLTGGSGLLGTELRKQYAGLHAPSHEELDVADAAGVAAYVASLEPDIIVHAAAITDNRDIEDDPAESLRVNIQGTVNLALACLGTRIRLVYLSTDYVYKGDRGTYAERDELLPGNLYAWTKLAGEAAVRAVPNHLIIRTSLGAGIFPYPGAFSDKWTSKDYVDVVAPQILEAARSPLTGVLNIGAPRHSMYEHAVERNPDVQKIERQDSLHESPSDTSLDLSRWDDYRAGRGVVRGLDACRVCGGADLVKYLDLGMMPLANNLAPSAQAAKGMQRFPMQVLYCQYCSLSQLSVVIDPEELFSHYAYRSSINRGYVRHCREMAKAVRDPLQITRADLVVDIAGNDGALLREFRDELGVNVLNVEPAANIAEVAEASGIPTINRFWSMEVAEEILARHERPKLVTATNVFAHVDDVRGFLETVAYCLHAKGALMLEFPYAVDFIEQREFDTVYFEHLSYLLIEPVRKLAESIGLKVFDVQKQDIHGGTVRVFIGWPDAHETEASVSEFVEREKAGGFRDQGIYASWNAEVDGLIAEIVYQLRALKHNGSRIAAFAASAKGNTLLNACRLDGATIDYIVDDTPEKIGRFSPGTGIPVVDRSVLAAEPPDYLLILAWNFASEIIENTAGFGGKYILPIPEFRVVEPEGRRETG